MLDDEITISILKNRVKKFIAERDWMKYHNPKNIAESIIIESAELLECFQWRNINESIEYAEKHVDRVSEEVADIMIYLLSLVNILNIDLSKAVIEKLKIDEKKYPIEKYKGRFWSEE